MNLSEKSFSSDQPIGDKNTGNYQSDSSISADDKLNEKLYSYYLEKAQEPNSNMIGDLKEEEVVTIKETIIGIDKQSSEAGEIPQTFSIELGNQICSDSNISSLYINDVENIYIYLKDNNIEEDK